MIISIGGKIRGIKIRIKVGIKKVKIIKEVIKIDIRKLVGLIRRDKVWQVKIIIINRLHKDYHLYSSH